MPPTSLPRHIPSAARWDVITAAVILAIFFFLSTLMIKTVNDRYLSSQLTAPHNFGVSAEDIFYDQFVALAPKWNARTFDPSRHLHNRHMFRWVGKFAEAKFLDTVVRTAGKTAARHVYVVAFGLVVTMTLGFCFLTIAEPLSQSAISQRGAVYLSMLAVFAAHLFYLALMSPWAEGYTFLEALFLAAALYFITRQRLVLFILIAVAAALVRESALIISSFWLIARLAHRERLEWRDFAPPVIASLALLLLNYDLLMQSGYWQLGTYLSGGDTAVSLTNILTMTDRSNAEKTISLLLAMSAFFPLVLILALGGSRAPREYIAYTALYLLVVVLGNRLQNAFLYFLLTPIWTVMLGYKLAAITESQ